MDKVCDRCGKKLTKSDLEHLGGLGDKPVCRECWDKYVNEAIVTKDGRWAYTYPDTKGRPDKP
jgi:hypothetical protein